MYFTYKETNHCHFGKQPSAEKPKPTHAAGGDLRKWSRSFSLCWASQSLGQARFAWRYPSTARAPSSVYAFRLLVVLCRLHSFFPSLYGLMRPVCGHELYPLRAVPCKAPGHGQQRWGQPRVPQCGSLERSTSRAVVGKGCSCLSSVPAWGCVHV